MVMISMGGEARTPSYHSMGSPRYGGCVGAFLHFFDWSPGKRFYSTKRLPASKPEEGSMRRSRSMRSDHGSTARTRMIFDAQQREDGAGAEEGSSAAALGASGIILAGNDAAASSRAPSVVARLMGLDSLPKGPYQPSSATRHRRSQSYTGAGELPFAFMTRVDEPPVVLQELLQRDFKASKKTLRDRMPGFAKRAQEQYENRFTKKGAALKVLRCRQDECMSPYIDIPKSAPKQPFLLRLAPVTSSTPRASSSPSEVSMDGIVSELGVQAAGWPLAGKVSRESSFRSERSSLLESECSSSRPASTKSSKPALANVARKIFQGRRRATGTSWNGSEDSESNSSQVETDLIPARAPLQHRKPRVAGREAALKKVAPPPSRRDRTIRTKPSATHHEASVREFKPSGTRIPAIPKTSIRTSSSTAKAVLSSEAADDSGQADQRQPLIQSRSRSTDFGVEAANSTRTSSAASASQESTASQTANVPLTSTSRSKGGRPGAKFTRISKPDTAKMISKAPPLDGYRAPKVMRDGLPKGYGKLLGADKAKAHTDGVVSSKQSTKNTLQGIQRVRETMLANTDRLKRGVDEMATPSNSALVADDTVCGNRKNGVVSKHARARSIDDVFPELPLDSNAAVPMSTEVLKPPVVSSEVVCEEVFHVDLQEFFAAGPDDLRWEEDEQRVNSPELSGRFCERSCSGPSVSSASVDVSDVDDERNGDAWSSCASYNAADCDSPRTFELPDTDADECDLHEPKSAPMFVKKIATGVDEAAGQPSPVSILNSPFHDEAGTTSECTLNSDEDGFKSPKSSQTLVTDSENIPCTPKQDSDHDKIRQALLDISMFQSFTFDYKEIHSPKESEQGFVREVLSAANFMSTPGSSPNWFDQDVVIDPSLFDRLESGETDGVEKLLQSRSGGLWRCDRKLLFDCVNEAFALTLWQHWRCCDIMPGLQWCCARPRGQKLVEEVYKKIEEWRTFTALSVDFLIERDMGFGDWKHFSAEVAEVGLDIESMIWKAIVEEVVMDLMATLKPR